jgi:Restriction endonuclease
MPKGWAKVRRRVLARDNGICYLCGHPGADSVDHVIPHARGGSDDYSNLRAAHMGCNDRKRAKVIIAVPRRSRFG